MEKDRSFRAIAVTALCIAILGVSVAFAAMSTTLSINGTANFVPSTWNIYFANLSAATNTGYAKVNTAPTIESATTTVLSTFDVTLKAPGDSVSWTFDIVNGGSLDAKIDATFKMPVYDTVNNGAITCTGTGANAEADAAIVCRNLVYSLKYDGTTQVAAGNSLNKSTSKNVTLTISYPSTVTEIPSDTVTINGLNISIPYIQDIAS